MSDGKPLWFMASPVPPTLPDLYLGIGHLNTPFLTIYDYTNPLIPVKLSDPSTLPPALCNSISFRNGTNLFSVGHSITPFISLYSIASGVISKNADPATLPPREVIKCRFSADGRYLAIGCTPIASLQTLFFYDFLSGVPILVSGTPSIDVAITNISWDPTVQRCMVNELIFDLTSGTPVVTFTLANTGYLGSRWSGDGRYLCGMRTSSGFINFWDWDSGSPVILSLPAVPIPTTGRDCVWDLDDDRIITCIHNGVGMSPNNTSTRYDLTTGAPLNITDLNPDPSASGAGFPTEIAIRNDNTLIAVGSGYSVDRIFMYDNLVVPPVLTVKPPSSGAAVLGIDWGGF